MIRYIPVKRASCVSMQGQNQGYIPWVFLNLNIILNKPDWGTLTIL